MRTLYIRMAAVAVTSIHANLAPAASRVTVQTLIPPASLVMLPAYPVIMEWISTFYEKEVQGEAAG